MQYSLCTAIDEISIGVRFSARSVGGEVSTPLKGNFKACTGLPRPRMHGAWAEGRTGLTRRSIGLTDGGPCPQARFVGGGANSPQPPCTAVRIPLSPGPLTNSARSVPPKFKQNL